MKPIVLVWLRRDLRLHDNHALFQALSRHQDVIPIFIFDRDILDVLDHPRDARVGFIRNQLEVMDQRLARHGKGIRVFVGKVLEVFKELTLHHPIEAVYANRDDEPNAIERDRRVASLLKQQGGSLHLFKDKAVFERDDVLKNNGQPYSVFTPYRNKWMETYDREPVPQYPSEDLLGRLCSRDPSCGVLALEEIGFLPSDIPIPHATVDPDQIARYADRRDFPSQEGTSRLGVHLRFGTLSPRQLVAQGMAHSGTWLNELVWREFFQQALYHHPYTVDTEFRATLRGMPWRRDQDSFQRWCEGRTGFPLIDAGMRELVSSGHMHNRVRMLVASFLVKHLLIDWRWGERFFAKHLLDFELASNVGNWQWAAGTGCDAAPYFRIFNPTTQAKRFDPQQSYIRRWLPEWGTPDYPRPLVDLDFARQRVLSTYRQTRSENTLL